MNKMALLSGASGLIGTALSQELTKSGWQYTQLVRSQPQSPNQVEWRPGSGQAPDPGTLPPVDVAVHLSGANVADRRWTPARKREIRDSRVVPTRALAAALARTQPKPRLLVCASAIGIYGERGDEILDETSQPGTGFLPEVCLEWEAAAAEAVSAGIAVVHARFGVVLSRRGGALAKMLPVFRLGLGGPLGDGHAWMSCIGLEDTIRALLFLMEAGLSSQPATGPFNLVGPDPVTNREFTRQLSAAVHRPAILPAPAFALRLAFGEMADEALLASMRVVPRRLLEAGFRFAHPTLSEALRSATLS